MCGFDVEQVSPTIATSSTPAAASGRRTIIVAGVPRYLVTSASSTCRPAATLLKQPSSVEMLIPPIRELGEAALWLPGAPTAVPKLVTLATRLRTSAAVT